MSVRLIRPSSAASTNAVTSSWVVCPHAPKFIAVYRHQVEACAEAATALLHNGASPYDALSRWVDQFVDFVDTKHGLAEAMQSDHTGFETLHEYFLARLVPACTHLLSASAEAGQIRPDIDATELMYAVGNLCAGTASRPQHDPRRMVHLLIAGLRSDPT